MTKIINRRKFFKETSLSTAGFIMTGNMTGFYAEREKNPSSYNLMKEVMKYRKFDAHDHVGLFGPFPEDADKQIDIADRLGIERLSISNPITRKEDDNKPEKARECNDIVYKAMKRHPNRFVGFFTLNPLFQKESLEEIKRCADLGFAGYKGYTQVKVNDPLYYPIIEKLIDLKMICFMHAECELGIGGYRMKYDAKVRPNATIPEDMADAAKRYPEAIFQWAHIGGGGDWEYMCKSFINIPNIYVDTSGSNNEEGMIDEAIKMLGEDRLFFGSDNSYYQSVGKILASNTTEAQRKKIFFDNYNNILRKGGYHVD